MPPVRRALADRIAGALGYQRARADESGSSLRRRSFTGNGGNIWSGAAMDRTVADWNPYTFAPNHEIAWSARFLRARARELVRNNDYASGFLESVVDNVVGPEGRILRAKIKLADGKTLATTTNREIERGWKAWGAPAIASADARDSWKDIQRLHIRAMAMDGEVLIRKLPGFANPFAFALQFIDPDLLDETYNVPGSGNQNEIRLGVELDRYGKAVAYWIWNRYPTERTGTPLVRERIPATEIIHNFVRYRPNQVRGLTWFAPVLTRVHQLDGYTYAELVRARNAASTMGFILNKQQEAIAGFDPLGEIEKGKKRQLEDMETEPGIYRELFPGQEVAHSDPNAPNAAVDVFETTILRGIARGLNVSHFTLTGDTRQANYSSMRVSLTPERDHWKKLQGFEEEHFDLPVYRDWLGMALLAGAVVVDSRLAADYYDVAFEGRGWKWVDPANDIAAAKAELRLGINSRQRLAAERGTDYEEMVEEQEHELDVANEHGVDVSGVDVIREPQPTPDQGGEGTLPSQEKAPDPAQQQNAALFALVDRLVDAQRASAESFAAAIREIRAAFDGSTRAVESQARALSAAAHKPPAPVVIEKGAIAVTNVTPAPKQAIGTRRIGADELRFVYDEEGA